MLGGSLAFLESRAARGGLKPLASENEVYLSDEMYRLPDAADLLAGMERVARTVHVKGIEREIVVHVLRALR
jgi:hypothetical protein